MSNRNVDGGFVKLHRKMMYWEWYKDINTFKVFTHCLLKANHKTNKWQSITIERGSFVSSINKIAEETGLSIQEVRTAIKKLIKTNELTKYPTTKYTIFTVTKYNFYQDTHQAINNQLTNEQPTNNRQLTTNKNEKKEKNEKKGQKLL